MQSQRSVGDGIGLERQGAREAGGKLEADRLRAGRSRERCCEGWPGEFGRCD